MQYTTIVFVGDVVVKDIFTVAIGARQDDGSYPNVFAWDTTLERNVCTIKEHFVCIFALKPR